MSTGFHSIRQEFNNSLLAFSDRHNIDTELKKTPNGIFVDLKDVKDPTQSLLNTAKNVDTRIFNFLYSPEDAKNAIEVLEYFVLENSKHIQNTKKPELVTWTGDMSAYEFKQAKKAADKALNSPKNLKRHMKTFTSLEHLYKSLEKTEGDQKIEMPSKIKTTIRQVEKIFADASMEEKKALGEHVKKAITVLKGYKKKLE